MEQAGKQVAKGPADSKIAYVRKLSPGRVELTEFKELIVKPKDSVILDVEQSKKRLKALCPTR